MPELTPDTLTAALARVIDPTFDKPMLELGTLADIRVEDGGPRMTARLAAPGEIDGPPDEVGIRRTRTGWRRVLPRRDGGQDGGHDS